MTSPAQTEPVSPEPLSQEPRAATAELRDGYLRVHFPADDTHGDFHFRWLRHNCDQDRHPVTGERVVDSSELPDRIAVDAFSVDGHTLSVRWLPDGRVSRYAVGWLRRHAYALGRRAVPPPPSSVEEITIAGAGLPPGEVARRALEVAGIHGAAVVRRDPLDTLPPEETTETVVDAFAALGLRVIETHFGRIEDLRTDNTTNRNTDQLGYTDSAVDLHTDQPFLDEPPRYQLLQAIRPADEGGDNFLVDALAAARHLESLDAPAAELLRTVPVHFHRKQRAFERLVISPILAGEGDSFRVRYSYFTMAPHQVPFERMEAWYRAYDRFARLVRDPRHQRRFRLGPGDFVFYDNHRTLHARTSFRGARWVRGIYFDR